MSDPYLHFDGEPVSFAINGQRFKLRPLPCDVALEGLDLIKQTVFPAIDSLIGLIDFKKLQAWLQSEDKTDSSGDSLPEVFREGVTESDFAAGLRKALCLGELPKLYNLFAPHCDCYIVTNPEAGQEILLPVLKSTTVFARKSALCVAWIIECLRIEYADFLSGTGLRLIWQTANQLISHLGSDPKSG
jgi:hypothetical protein